MIYMEDATKEQLLQIALHEDCSIDYKYEAVRELQVRSWQDWMLTDTVRMWARGWRITDIAAELGVDIKVLEWQIEKHGLYGKRLTGRKRVKS